MAHAVFVLAVVALEVLQVLFECVQEFHECVVLAVEFLVVLLLVVLLEVRLSVGVGCLSGGQGVGRAFLLAGEGAVLLQGGSHGQVLAQVVHGGARNVFVEGGGDGLQVVVKLCGVVVVVGVRW